MGTRFRHLLNGLASSYWFVPLIVTAAGAVLAAIAVQVDVRTSRGTVSESWAWVYTGGSDGAWALLSTIATSIMTVGGVAFSITMVTLTQASSQFGPRLLRTFMRAGHNQVVLGAFTGTFVYCLVVLRTIRSAEEMMFVPQLAVTGAFLLAIVCVALLVYFIHHTARSLQAPIVVATLGRQLEQAIAEQLRPDDTDDGGEMPPAAPGAGGRGRVICAVQQGYLQVINRQALLRTALEHQLTLLLTCRAGKFVALGSSLMTAFPTERVGEAVVKDLRGAFLVGDQRTEEQDAGFVMYQLVEIAVRALSPGINDPHTALTCVDWLGAALRRLTREQMRGGARLAGDRQVRMFVLPVTFDELLTHAFGEIRQYGAGSAAVMIRLLDVLAELADAAASGQRAALLREVELTYQQSADRLAAADRYLLDQAYQQALRSCTGGSDDGRR